MSKLFIVGLFLTFGSVDCQFSGSRVSTVGRECFRRDDCNTNQRCNMFDFTDLPAMWPPCRHYGLCECLEGTAQASNGTCVQFIYLNLGDPCSNRPYESFDKEVHRCDGRRVVCNPPFVLRNNYCERPPPPTTRWTPLTTAWTAAPIFTRAPPVSRITVGYREACDATTRICDNERGLCCERRGPTADYSQCLCCDKQKVYDDAIGYCRARVYGDLCTENEHCNSGLISNTGFECRLGRCRCVTGYDPVDSLFWNATSKTTYSYRICVISGAVHWVPTGHTCTMEPHRYAQFNSTRVCHRRAFCHQCYRERTAGRRESNTGATGVCRELTCNGGCDGGNGQAMSCTNFQGRIDPPCENGMCGCDGSGLYIDRFSQCAPYKQLSLGDRCLAGNGLNKWYITNEGIEQSHECVSTNQPAGGYPGYSWGVVKCKLPLIEDYSGNCVRNDDPSGIEYTYLNFLDQCDDNDNRIPIPRCSSEAGLACRNKRCVCTGAGSGGGFVSSSHVFFDGAKCRRRTLADRCNRTTDCQTGEYYPGTDRNAALCYQGLCTCGQGYAPADIGTLNFDTGETGGKRYCMRNFTYVQKGQECHLDALGHATRASTLSRNRETTLICQPGLYCIRCPADFNPEDEARGYCRDYRPPPTPQPSCAAPGFPGHPQPRPPPGTPVWTPVRPPPEPFQPPAPWTPPQPGPVRPPPSGPFRPPTSWTPPSPGPFRPPTAWTRPPPGPFRPPTSWAPPPPGPFQPGPGPFRPPTSWTRPPPGAFQPGPGPFRPPPPSPPGPFQPHPGFGIPPQPQPQPAFGFPQPQPQPGFGFPQPRPQPGFVFQPQPQPQPFDPRQPPPFGK